MCTNFTPTTDTAWVKRHFSLDLPALPNTEVYPGQMAPIAYLDQQGQLQIELAQFGLLPSWVDESRAKTFHRTPTTRASRVFKPSQVFAKRSVAVNGRSCWSMIFLNLAMKAAQRCVTASTPARASPLVWRACGTAGAIPMRIKTWKCLQRQVSCPSP